MVAGVSIRVPDPLRCLPKAVRQVIRATRLFPLLIGRAAVVSRGLWGRNAEDECPGPFVDQIVTTERFADADMIGVQAEGDHALQAWVRGSAVHHEDSLGGLILEEDLCGHPQAAMIFPVPGIQLEQRRTE